MHLRVVAVVVAGLVGLLVPPASGGGPAAPPGRGEGAVFQVGAAVRSIAPLDESMRTHVGGYGDCFGCPDSGGTLDVREGDDLDVRVLYVSDGATAAVVATVPAEGWFAGYQHGEGYGLTELRAEAARALSEALPVPPAAGIDGVLDASGRTSAQAVSQGNIIVSTSHCHACPTLVGLTGPTNTTYLRYVYEQTLAAILDAQRSARPAHLERAVADFGYVNDITVGQPNANEGWPVDGQLSALRARDARTGRTVATWLSVPVHGNITHGPSFPEMSSEHFGAAAREVERRSGGVAVVVAGTLGDQTSPMQADGSRMPEDPRPSRPSGGAAGYPHSYDVIERLGALTASTALHALDRTATRITDPVVRGAEVYQLVPASNPLLLAIAYGHVLPDVPGVVHNHAIAGIHTADRSILPPYVVGNGVGVWFTVLRLGDVAIASQPGEAFPHVTFAIREALRGAAMVAVVGNAQDQLGYYYEPHAYPSTYWYSANHDQFHIGPTLAQQNVDAVLLAGSRTGFDTAPAALLSGLSSVTDNDYTRYFLKAGVQTLAFPRGASEREWASRTGRYPDGTPVTDGISIPVGVYAADARGRNPTVKYNTLPTGTPGEARTAEPRLFLDGAPVPVRGTGAVVTVPRPGRYLLTAELPGTTATWATCLHVRSASDVRNSAVYPSGTGPHPLADPDAARCAGKR